MKTLELISLLLFSSCASVHLPFYDGNTTIRVSKNSEINWKKYKSIGLREITLNGQPVSNEKNVYYRKAVNDKLKNDFPELKIVQVESLHQTLKNNLTKRENIASPDLYLDVVIYAENRGEFKDIPLSKINITTYVNAIERNSGILIKSGGAGFVSSILDAQSTSLDIAIKRLKRKEFWIEIPSIGKSKDENLRVAYDLMERNEFEKSQLLLDKLIANSNDGTLKIGRFYALSLLSYLQDKQIDGEKFLLLSLQNGLKEEDAWTLNGKIKNIKELRGTDYGRAKNL